MSRKLIFCLLLVSLGAQAAVDPTLPPTDLRSSTPTSSPGVLGALKLQAILRGGTQGNRAVIDGQTLRVGDSHGRLRVLAIHAQSVLIERQGQQQLLRLAQPIVKPSR